MKTQSKNGSVLGLTMIFVWTLLVIAVSIIALALNSYRLSMRNNVRAEARAVAETELEALFYQFEREIFSGTLPANVPGALDVDNAATPTNLTRSAFLEPHRTAGWQVGRSVQVSAPFTGVMTGSTKIGTFNNVEARVIIQPPALGPWANSGLAMRCGRVMTASHATIFQVCIFYQGTDLEMAPSGDVLIDGEIICNGSIFLASNNTAASHLRLTKNVYYLQGGVFNKADAGADGIWDTADDTATLRKPDTPVVNSNLKPPEWEGGGETAQLKMLTEPENLLGGADATTIQAVDPELFPTVNDVYRSVLVPPPEAGNTNEYSATALGHADNPVIAAQRVYNKAGLIVTVDNAGNATFKKVVGGVATDVTYPDVVTSTVTMYDDREKRNVTVTTIDISKLKDHVGEGSTYDNFNGLVYVNLKSGDSNTPSAVRLTNAETLPSTPSYDGGHNGGFSLATNGGLYIQGSYNTTQVADKTGANITAPSMLMGDAITVLSDSWDDAKSSDPVASRQALSNDTVSPTDTTLTNWTTINAGLLTGSVPATDAYASGGAQNLIRYLEDWYTTSQNVKLFGSFGRLFNSKVFTRPWIDPTQAGAYYIQPRQRQFGFNHDMVEHTPPGSPEISAVERGRFFFW